MSIRAKLNSFEKLKNNFGTEIGPKIAFNTIYEKRYFLCFLAMTFLIGTLLPLGLRTGNLLQKWAKFLCYMLHFLKKARPSFFQTSKFKLFFTFLQKFLIIHPQKENTVLMNTRLYSLKIRLEEVSTLRETCFRT